MHSARHCRPEAFAAFRAAVADLDRSEGLVAAATALAGHALGQEADLDHVRRRLAGLAARVGPPTPGASLQARLAHLHRVLFDEERFAGNRTDYYAPENSFLPRVLETRRGIPITLALVYRVVGETAGLCIDGVGAPGHFLVRVRDEHGTLLVDPFHGGRTLSEREAFALMEAALGADLPAEPRFLSAVDGPAWVARMLRNLEAIYTRRALPRDAAAMRELRGLLAG